MNILVDNGEYFETTLNITANTLSTYELLFEKTGTYFLELQIPDLGHSYTTNLIIEKYTGELPVIDTDNDALELYLNPRGKTNDSIDKNIWVSHNKNYTAKLEDFYFESVNGWMTDEEGVPYLKISQGAKLTLNDYRPFRNDAMNNSNYGIMVELDFKVSGILDFSQELIKCVSRSATSGFTNCGFSVTGNSFFNGRS